MPNWFYFEKNEKKGPFTSEELFSLATTGTIHWGTIVETDDGRQTLAKNVKGLFPTQESDTKRFVVAPPVVIPPMPRVENQVVPPAVSSDEAPREDEEISHAVSPSWKKVRVPFVLKCLLLGCCLFCFLLCAGGIYFAWEAAEEREFAEKKIQEYSPGLGINVYVGADAYNYIINGTYFTGYSVRSLQRTIQSSVCFLLAGMFGTTAFFLFLRLPFSF